MNDLSDIPQGPAQIDRLSRFGAEQSVEMHCHCLPGVDDGPATMEDAIRMCCALVEDGVTTVIATPHQLGAYEGRNAPSEIRLVVESLRQALAGERIPLRVVAGAEVRLDEQVLNLLEGDGILTLADGGVYLLLEMPHDTFIDPLRTIDALSARGITTIIAHPERHRRVAREIELARPWIQHGALLQINCESLLGGLGSSAVDAAWQLIATGMAAMVASDAHDISRRPPSMSRAVAAIAAEMGHAVARRLCIERPLRVLLGKPIAMRPAAAIGAASAMRFTLGGRR